jgi:hypothetical protein
MSLTLSVSVSVSVSFSDSLCLSLLSPPQLAKRHRRARQHGSARQAGPTEAGALPRYVRDVWLDHAAALARGNRAGWVKDAGRHPLLAELRFAAQAVCGGVGAVCLTWRTSGKAGEHVQERAVGHS